MATAFQSNAFQNNAFQIDSGGYGFGQANAQITTKTPNAQAQARIIGFNITRFANAQTDIKEDQNYKLAQAQVLIIKISIGQAQAYIIRRAATGQTQTFIANSKYGLGQALTTIITKTPSAQAQALINYRLKLGQAQAKIADPIGAVRVSQAPIAVIVKPSDSKIRVSQAPITVIVKPSNANVRTSQVVIEVILKNSKFGVGQAQALVVGQRYQSGQAQADIKVLGQNVFGQTQADIKTVGRGYGQTQCYVQAQVTYGVGQAQVQITTRSPNGQAQAKLIGHYNAYGQAQADIKAISSGFGQAMGTITSRTPAGQAQAFINQGLGTGQTQARILAIYINSGNTQALIKKLVIKSGQAQGNIKHGGAAYAQAMAFINIKMGFGQAQCSINLHVASGQAQGSIKTAVNSSAQALAQITRAEGYGQAQAAIRHGGSGQAQAHIRVGTAGYGQARAFISKGTGLGQTQADIKVTFIATGTALANILKPSAYGQAQGKIKRVGSSSYGQAMATIGHLAIGQAQSFILSNKYYVNFNGYQLPGYAQSENYDSIITINSPRAPYYDGSLSEYFGLLNKQISLKLKTLADTFAEAKEQMQLAATILRSKRSGWAKLYIQGQDKYFLALTRRISTESDAAVNIRSVDYTVEFETKPWIIGDTLNEISGTGTIETTGRTLSDGTWTPVKLIVSGTNVEISGITEYGLDAGSIQINGTVNNLMIDTEMLTVTLAGISRNDLIINKDFSLFVGPGKTTFTITGATACTIQYNNRWLMPS